MLGLELTDTHRYPHCCCLVSSPSFSYLHQRKQGPAVQRRKPPIQRLIPLGPKNGPYLAVMPFQQGEGLDPTS